MPDGKLARKNRPHLYLDFNTFIYKNKSANVAVFATNRGLCGLNKSCSDIV